MKPLSGARIATAVQRVKERLKATPASLNGLLDALGNPPRPAGHYLRWINASRGEDVQLITIEEVRYFQSDMKYTRVVAAKARRRLIRQDHQGARRRARIRLDVLGRCSPRHHREPERRVESVGRGSQGARRVRLKDRPEVAAA
jgi:hypothetical protein